MKDDSGVKGRSWGTLVYRPSDGAAQEIGDGCGIFQCKNPFCAGAPPARQGPAACRATAAERSAAARRTPRPAEQPKP